MKNDIRKKTAPLFSTTMLRPAAFALLTFTGQLAYAQAANQTVDMSAGNACVSAGGALVGPNIFTAAANGTFGTGSGAADEFLATNIYAPEVTGTRYNNSYSGYLHGDFSYVSNQVNRRNGFQFEGPQIDPVYGVTGIFMVIDPDDNAPVLSTDLLGLIPGSSYEASFWVADTEYNTGGDKNRIAVDVDGTQEFITPFINSNGNGNDNNPVVWQKHSYVYTHAAASSSATVDIRVNETGAGGRDIFLDNIEVRTCAFPNDLTTIKSLPIGENPRPVEGDTVTFEIAITNNGPGIATGVSLTDTLPAGLTATAANGTIVGDTNSSGGTYNVTTGEWSVGIIAVDETVTLRLVGTVNAGQTGNTITNTVAAATANETDPTTAGDDLTETVVINAPPTALDDDITSGAIEPVNVNLFANNGNGVDSDFDGGTLVSATIALIVPGSVTVVGTPVTDGAGRIKSFVVDGEGEWAVDNAGVLTFTPTAGFTDDPTDITYTVNDNDGATSNAATVSIDYGDAPVATDDTAANPTIGTPTSLDPFADNGNGFDSDPDGGTLDPATVTLVGSAGPGADLVVAGEGTWSVDTATGAITFTPLATFTGDPTPVNYTVDDNDGNTSNAATVTVTYGAPPVANDDTVAATDPGPVSIDPLANDDTDNTLDPTSVVLTGTDAPAGSTLAADGKTLTVPGQGVWSVDPNTGLVTFTPEAGFSGTPTPAGYTVSDTDGRVSNEAVLNVTVLGAVGITAANDGPIAVDGSNGDTSDVSVLNNDTLDGISIADPSLVTLTPVSVPTPASGSITLNPDGTVTVAENTTPGTYTLTYEICETANPTNCATADVELVVVDAGTGLINEVAEDLESILSEDLTNTLTQQGTQISGYSADAVNRLRNRGGEGNAQCMAAVNFEARNILFNVDSAVILPDYFKPVRYETLDRIAAILNSCPGTAFEIAGHTDSDASDAYNIDLSQRRVTAVLRALAERGVDTSGFVARGYGERQPIASNATAAGKAQNRRVEFLPLEDVASHQGPCDDSFSLVRNLNAKADENGMMADGQFVRDQHDCITDRREVFEGTLSYLDTQTGQTQSAINLSYRREQYRDSDSVFGYFVGLYGTKSEVTRLADGEINGFGLNGGVYGANRLDSELFLDYYLGAAAGRHSFDLAFDRDIGTINADGTYQYFAGFAGAALSGEVELGDTTLTPRVGVDYVYTPGADVEVVAELSGLTESGDLDLDAVSGGRAFAELRLDHRIDEDAANLWINPRVACYQSLGTLDGACGFGGSIGIESVEQENGLTYAAELDGEWGENYTQGSLSLRASREVGMGTLSGDAGVTRNGGATLGGAYEINF